MFGLQHLVSPVPVDEFIYDYWGKKAIYIPGGVDKFPGLFGWGDVDKGLNYNRMNYDGFRMVYEKQNLPHEEFANLEKWLFKGATLVLNHVNQVSENVRKFENVLEHDLNTRININSYVSCPSKQGFDIHFDRHDVFIIQTEGKKEWKVFEQTAPFTYPLHIQGNDKGKPPEDAEPYLDCVMSEGDVMYIPRGHWHYAVSETPCVHLTVGPASRTGSEFLFWLTQKMMNNDEFFREDFPLIYASEFNGPLDDGALQRHLEKFKDRVKELIDSEALDESFIKYIMLSNGIRRSYQMPETWEIKDSITPETVFEIPEEQKFVIRYNSESKYAMVYSRGDDIELKNIPEDLLKALFSETGRDICGSVLQKEVPDIGWDKIKFALLLLYEKGLMYLKDR